MEFLKVFSEKFKIKASILKNLKQELKNEIFKEQFMKDMDSHLSEKLKAPSNVSYDNIISIMEIIELEAKNKLSEELLEKTDNVNFVKIKNNRLDALQKKDKDENISEDVVEESEDDDSDEDGDDMDEDSDGDVELPPKYNIQTKEHYLSIIKYIYNTKQHLSPRLMIKYLCLLPKFLPYVDNPLDYADILFNAFDSDGVISAAALPGVYYLVTRKDLDYQNIYEKVYKMMGRNALNINCRINFFQTVQDILFSPYVPEYIAAAFVKKASRLTLEGPDCRLLLVAFIKNILIKFPSLRHLIHSPDPKEFDTDPFLENETAINCRAMESSLWELEVILNSPLKVSRAASFIKRELPEYTTRLDKMNKNSPAEIFSEALKIRKHIVSTNFDKPDGFSYPGNEMMGWEWS